MSEIQRQQFSKEELFPLEQYQLWTIDEGFVRTVNFSDSGDIVTLGLWGEGDVVGQPLSDNRAYAVECLTRVKAHPIRLNQVDLNAIRLDQVHQMEKFLNILHCRPLPHRLWLLLRWLGDRFAVRQDRGDLLDMRLTHQAIAEMIGSTRVTVSRLLKDYELEGRISRLSRQKLLLIKDKHPLELKQSMSELFHTSLNSSL